MQSEANVGPWAELVGDARVTILPGNDHRPPNQLIQPNYTVSSQRPIWGMALSVVQRDNPRRIPRDGTQYEGERFSREREPIDGTLVRHGSGGPVQCKRNLMLTALDSEPGRMARSRYPESGIEGYFLQRKGTC